MGLLSPVMNHIRKVILLVSIVCAGFAGIAKAQQPTWRDFESLLCKPIASPKVQDFIKTNHLRQEGKSEKGTGICYNDNSCFEFSYKSNIVTEVDINISHDSYQKYTGELGHGLQRDDTEATVEKKLGQPSRRFRPKYMDSIYLNYEKLGLGLLFNIKTGRLEDAELTCPH